MADNKGTAVATIEKEALSVSYMVGDTPVKIDIDFVKKYLVRGKAETVSNQELVFFINTCKAQKLNPLANGEVYLIKYNSNEPAQLVVGKDAYVKRAFLNPNYLGTKNGIVVIRGNNAVIKEGTCVYPNEKLWGGWCKIYYKRKGSDTVYEAYKEVSLDEYNKGMANWKSKPATMINKVAISQCMREAFPTDFIGLYSEDEMIASGAIPAEIPPINQPSDKVIDLNDEDSNEDSNEAGDEESGELATQDEKLSIFSLAKSLFGKEQYKDMVMEKLGEINLTGTDGITKKQVKIVLESLQEEYDLRCEAMILGTLDDDDIPQ